MTSNEFDWEAFYNNVSGRQPRDLLLNVLGRFADEPATTPRKAIDLGCGDGTETAYLLAKGWDVLAIDSEPTAFTHLNAKIPTHEQQRLQTQVSKFESVELSPADLIHASYSLPFCQPQHFDSLWAKIVANLNSGGRFAGQLLIPGRVTQR